MCIPGCVADDDCDGTGACDPHGRCLAGDDEAPPLAAAPTITDRVTVLELGEIEARTILRNDGPGVLTYRLQTQSPALSVDSSPAELAPSDEIELVAAVDLDTLAPEDRVLPVQILTSAGTVTWTIQIEAAPESGHFRGAVNFDTSGISLGSSQLILDLDFRDDGTIAGRLDTDASLLWPQPVALTGTWTPAGDIAIELRDHLPAESWRHSPIARELGRSVVLTGTRTAAGLQGTIGEAITGLRDVPVQVEGTFALRRHGPLMGLVHAAGDFPGDAAPPTWLAPPGLDTDACGNLGMSYGTASALPEPSPACNGCADGSCTAEDKIECGDALRSAAYHLPAVLTELNGGGQVKPPSLWTWDDCTAADPTYENGQTCLDIGALRCAHALVRRGSVELGDAWGDAFGHYAALLAADEAQAAALLSLEAQIDAAFAFKDELGESVAEVLAREVDILDADRERLAAALAPMLAPAHLQGLTWLADQDPGLDTAPVRLAPADLVPAFARTTSQWASLAQRAGNNAADVRAAVRLAAIATHAAGAELNVRLGDDPSAAVSLRALGPALESLAAADAALSSNASYGYPAAYVPLALGPQDIAQHRSNFEAVHALAADDLDQLEQVAATAEQAIRDYEQKTHALEATAFQIAAEYDGKLRALCGSRPGETEPALDACGQHGGQIADLTAAVGAAGLRIKHAAQAVDNNLHAVAVEEKRFAMELAAFEHLEDAIADAQGRIFTVVNNYGEERSALVQTEAMAECTRVREHGQAENDALVAGCNSRLQKEFLSGPTIFGFSTPDVAAMILGEKECQAQQDALARATDNQCESIYGQAGLDSALEELGRNEDMELRTLNAEIDAEIRKSDLEVRRAASVALVKNLRAEALLLQIEVEEAELAREAAMTSLWSAYQEAAALTLEKAVAVGVMIEDSPDNALTRPHFLQARLEAARRVWPVREQTTRRVYLALRALEYEMNQPLPSLRDQLAAARSSAGFAELLACLDSIHEDYRLEHGFGQSYVTEVSLRADVFGITADVPDIDGSPATPAEQFAALLRDPLHRQPDGAVALPFALSAFEHALFSSALCDDRVEQIEVKLVGDYLGDREVEVWLTRQGLAGVRRCDGAELPDWSAYVPYSFEREQIVIQAGVGDFGTAGPNSGYAAWPVHGEQWTLTVPPPDQAPANADIDLGDISDVVLRLHHRAGSIAPAGQGLFTPTCGQ